MITRWRILSMLTDGRIWAGAAFSVDSPFQYVARERVEVRARACPIGIAHLARFAFGDKTERQSREKYASRGLCCCGLRTRQVLQILHVRCRHIGDAQDLHGVSKRATHVLL